MQPVSQQWNYRDVKAKRWFFRATPVRSSSHSEAGNTIPEVIAQTNFTLEQQERGLAVSSVQETLVMC